MNDRAWVDLSLQQYWTGYLMSQTLYHGRLNLHSLFWNFLSSCGIWSFVCGFSSHSRFLYSYGDAAVTWPKYCRYGVKRYPINQSYGDVTITVEGSQNLTYAPYARHLWPLSSQFVLLVWSLSSQLRIFHPSRKVTITGEERQILTYALHSWPLSIEGSLTCRTYCDTGQTL